MPWSARPIRSTCRWAKGRAGKSSAAHGSRQQGYGEGDADFGNHTYAYRERPARGPSRSPSATTVASASGCFSGTFPTTIPKPDTIGRSPRSGHYFAVSQTRPHPALRSGAGKLRRFHEDARVELYPFAAAAGEQEELSAREPGRTKALRARLEGELRALGARFPFAAGSLP